MKFGCGNYNYLKINSFKMTEEEKDLLRPVFWEIDINNLDYENHKETNNQYIAYSENKTVKMTYTLSNNTITKITLA